jgi:hypothetical protein
MNVLDENIIAPERERLRKWRVHFRGIGKEIGRLGMKDREDIIPLLHSLPSPTFFTRDHGFYRRILLHPRYCLVYLEIDADETAEYIRRLLRHYAFLSRTQRMGKVLRIRPGNVSYWQLRERKELSLSW